VVDTAGYLLVGAVAAGVTFVCTPLVAWLAHRVGWLAVPDERRVHQEPTPDVGGIAMMAGILAAFAVAASMDRFTPLFRGNSEPFGLLLAAGIMFLVGLADDIRPLSPPAKVTGTVVAGIVLVAFGVTMFYFRVPFLETFVLSRDWTPLVTVLWLLGITSAVNLIDGLDGLAAGIVAIASCAFFVYSQHLSSLQLLKEPNVGPLVAIVTFGVCIGFLPYNFNPARIFMGDGGALLIGSMMAVATSVVGGRADPATQQYSGQTWGQTYFFFAPLFIPLFILGVPILDTLFAVVRRATRRQGVTTADKGHLHHRLMTLGHGQRRSVLILWGWTALLSGLVLYPALTNSADAIGAFAVIGVALALFTVLHPQVRRRSHTG
jgi:UDP-GlcNAc:undecaprenyl-phosphate GlcNAc-1-phosphate transferase